MSAIEQLLHQPAAQAMGWALLHFIWQGALVGVLTALALAALRRSAADVRYVVATIGLSLMLTLPSVTAVQLWRAATAVASAQTIAPFASNSSSAVARSQPAGVSAIGAGTPGTTNAASSAAGISPLRVEPLLPVLVAGWLSGVMLLSLRLMSGWLFVQRMKTFGTSPAGEGWQHIAARLSRRLHIARRVRLLESTVVDVPTVIGWIKPVILLPASALAGLSPQQLEAILAHELAHIRRHDYLVNLLQTLVETLLFYHPAVWWLSRRIRTERENCCDDLAVSLCGDPYTYAKALADLEELRGGSGQLAMAANGGSLVQRVRRLLGAPTHAGRAPGWLAGTATVLVMLGIAAGAVQTDAFQASPAQVTASPATPRVDAARPESLQLLEDARTIAAAADRMEGKSRIVGRAAQAATWLQDNTGQATTPVLAGQTLAAEARGLHEAALAMAAQSDSRRALAGEARSAAAFGGEASAKAAALADMSSRLAGVTLAAAQNHATMSWSNNGERVEVRYDGEVAFTDDDADVKRLSPGGLFRIKEGGVFGGFFASHTVEFAADGSGDITRRFWDGMSERPFEPEGRAWMARYLPRFIRQTGFGAQARVARILKAKGPAGVLAEIALIEGSWGKRTYYAELLKTAALDAATVRQILTQAGRDIDSDFELASLLIDGAGKLLIDDSTRQAYFEAARTIESDFEMRRVFSTVLKSGPVSATLLAPLLEASRNIDSDFEEASLLVQVAKLQPLDNTTRDPFFRALATVDSDFEHRRVLSALAERTELTPEITAAMLTSGAAVKSDSEAASFLVQIAKQQPIEGTLRAPFFRAVDSIASAFERGRVLQTVAKRPDVSPDTILAVLKATAAIDGSSFEASQVLMAVSAHPVAGPARDAYIEVAEKLGDFEQGRVLAALVKSERRR